MKITIIPIDGTVVKDGQAYIGLDFVSCGIPADVHAFQWEENESNRGHIEYKSALVQNQDITELPAWTNACLAKWDEAKAIEEAAQQTE
jgi:hypothetical protein